MVTSFALISPETRGDAIAGGPELGKSASRKTPMRRASRFLLKRCLRKGGNPLSLPRSPPLRERPLCRREMPVYMVEREGAQDVTARCHSGLLGKLRTTDVQACASGSAF